MSRLDELIIGLCRNGVEYKNIGSVAKVTAGNSAPQRKELFINGIYPFCRTADVGKVKKSVDFDDIADRLTEEGIKGLKLFPKGSILIPKSGASTLSNNRVRLSIDSYVVSHLAVITPDEQIINSRYLYYAIEDFDMGKLVEDKSYPSVKSSKIAEEIVIPVPPMDVQLEIARILDSLREFSTKLNMELAEELKTRKKQYEYHRNQLLTYNESVKRVKVGDICNVFTGGEPPSDCIKGSEPDDEHPYAVWGNGKDVYGFSGQYRIDKDAVVISSIGANTGTVYYHKAFFTPIIRLKVIVPKDDSLDIRFLYHAMSAQRIMSKSSSVPNMNASEIKALSLPLPSIEEQKRIANILDRYHALCEDLSNALSAEIPARQKQYEYYRDKLLTFKDLEINV